MSETPENEHTVTVYEQVEDAEALASCLHRLTNHLHRNGEIDMDERNTLYDRIDKALGKEVPYSEAPDEAK